MKEAIPKNLENMSYEEIHQWVGKNIRIDAPIIKAKMEFKYDPNVGWNQVYNNLDLFKNYEHVQNVCGDNAICWMDSFNYSVMKQTDVTDFLYRMSANLGQVARKGVDKEIDNFKFNPEPLITLFHNLHFIDWFM